MHKGEYMYMYWISHIHVHNRATDQNKSSHRYKVRSFIDCFSFVQNTKTHNYMLCFQPLISWPKSCRLERCRYHN